MSRKQRTAASAVEKLIEQRRLFQDWLSRLEADVDGMPSHVVERVRNDYRARLAEVMSELSGYQDSLRQSRSDARSRQEELEKQQQARNDELAELRLRKHVGEIDDDKFKAESGSLKQQLDSLARELTACQRDIDRCEEILDAIAAASRAAGAAAAKEEEEEEEEEEEAKAAVDELEFLRSVTKAAPRKAESEPPLPPPPPPPPPPAPARPVARPAAAAAAAAKAAEKPPELDAAPGLVELKLESEPEPRGEPSRRSESAAPEKTVKCAECGTANLPTEWYCEKCGAELAAV